MPENMLKASAENEIIVLNLFYLLLFHFLHMYIMFSNNYAKCGFFSELENIFQSRIPITNIDGVSSLLE